MTLTKREQKIAWVVGGVVAIGLIFLLVNNLYLGTLDDVESQITNAQKKERDDSNTLEKAKVRNQQWENMDILSDPAAMGQLVHDHVTDLAGQAADSGFQLACPGGDAAGAAFGHLSGSDF